MPSNMLKQDLRRTVLPGIKNNNTKRAYSRGIDSFAAWAKNEGGPKHLRDVDADTIQRYTDHLVSDPKNYTPSTIHMKLAPICKGAGVNMDRISKPKRTAGRIVRGRREDANAQGKAQLQNPRYARCVALQKAVGIRRAELRRLKGGDWDGHYITVRRGKGGKSQRQWILPEDRDTVNRIFSGIGSDQLVLSSKEIPEQADLHSIRAEHAQKAYSYFQNIKNPDKRAKLKQILIEKFDKEHVRLKNENYDAYKSRRERFISDMDGKYVLRGENKIKAIELGLPTEYDKLSLMAVSVYELAHWRLDVTVVNYMIR